MSPLGRYVRQGWAALTADERKAAATVAALLLLGLAARAWHAWSPSSGTPAAAPALAPRDTPPRRGAAATPPREANPDSVLDKTASGAHKRTQQSRGIRPERSP
jgi:hypothetical protein